MKKMIDFIRTYWGDILFVIIWNILQNARYSINAFHQLIENNQIIGVLIVACAMLLGISIYKVVKSKARSLRYWNYLLMFLGMLIYSIFYFMYYLPPHLIAYILDFLGENLYVLLIEKNLFGLVICLLADILAVARIVVWCIKKLKKDG